MGSNIEPTMLNNLTLGKHYINISITSTDVKQKLCFTLNFSSGEECLSERIHIFSLFFNTVPIDFGVP